jgi:uncharacterized membrane protein
VGATDRTPRIGLGLVLVATLFTLFVGFAHKSICISGDEFNDRAYRSLCYNDIVPLYQNEGFSRGDFPYLEAPNEYPVLTGLFMWTASLVGRGEGDFFVANAVLLTGLALATSWFLYRAAGSRALFFALAPTLAIYAFLNWDLLAVALATAGTLAFLRRRDVPAGILLGLGVAAKLYPVLLLVPFAAERLREGDRRGAIRLAAAGAGAWLILNLPFVAFAFDRWARVFRFSSVRQVDWSTLWFAGCRTLTGRLECGHVRLVNVLSLVVFAIGAVWVWHAKVAREPQVPRWTLAFPLLIVFLLTTKINSPQYSLWLIPWFALVLPNLRLFIAYEVADLAVFVTLFSWLGRYFDGDGLSVGAMEIAVVARAAILVGILVVYVRRPTTPRSAATLDPQTVPA